MVQALVVVLENGHAFCLAAVVLGVRVSHVACEDFLPEGEAARGACSDLSVQIVFGVILPGSEQEAVLEGAAQWVILRWRSLAQAALLNLSQISSFQRDICRRCVDVQIVMCRHEPWLSS